MIKLGVIGLGTVFEWQYKAIRDFSDKIRVTSVYDIDVEKAKNTVSRYGIEGVTVHGNFEDFCRDDEAEAVLVSTPPHTHFDLSAGLLAAGRKVLLEKPVCLSPEDVRKLFEIKKENAGFLHTAYHASFAKDLLWYTDNADSVRKSHDPGALLRIVCGFFDPYMENGAIIPRKVPLGGSYIDSGVNALSVCERLVDLSLYSRESDEQKKDPSGVVYSSKTTYTAQQAGLPVIEIHTGWDRGLNRKTTELVFENGTILLDHSDQSVKCAGDASPIFADRAHERLHTHYRGVFEDFIRACDASSDNEAATQRIHRLLLGVK